MESTYRLMVVDDERIVREAIASHIPWETHGISVVLAAANALEALEYLQNTQAELILADASDGWNRAFEESKASECGNRVHYLERICGFFLRAGSIALWRKRLSFKTFG